MIAPPLWYFLRVRFTDMIPKHGKGMDEGYESKSTFLICNEKGERV